MIFSTYNTLSNKLKIQWLDPLILLSCDHSIDTSILRRELEKYFSINLVDMFYYIGMNKRECTKKIIKLSEGLICHSDAVTIFSITKQSEKINEFLLNKFLNFSSLPQKDRLYALNKLLSSIQYKPLFGLIERCTFKKSIEIFNIQIASTQEIDLYIKILPILIDYVQVPKELPIIEFYSKILKVARTNYLPIDLRHQEDLRKSGLYG